jgi:hypothetical protein
MVTSPTDLGPKNDCAGEASRSCKRQTRPLIIKSDPHQQTRNCLRIKKKSCRKPQMGALFQDRLAY